MVDSIRRSLPPVYQPLLGEFFDRPKVVEKRVDCDNCSMCDQGQAAPVEMEFFRPDLKCCTFWPALPNYLVGAILSDESPDMAEGRRRVRERIATRIGVGAHWLTRPRKLTHIMAGYGDAFGRAQSLRCPYFDQSNPAGSCTIWRHRETVCHTYYCKYSAGARGYAYWAALKDYLAHVQRQLAGAAAHAVDPRVSDPGFKKNSLSVEDIDDLPPKESDYKGFWGRWVGQEEAFYKACHAWVKSQDRDRFAASIDATPEGKKVLEALIAKYETLEAKILPATLIRNPRMREQHAGDKVVVTSYHRYDSFMLDKDLYEVVGMFRADQTLAENLERLRREEAVELTPDLVDFLFSAGVLVEPAKANASSAEQDAERKARRAALEAVLDARGLPIDEAAKTKLDAADAALLEQYIRRAAIATTLAEVLEPR